MISGIITQDIRISRIYISIRAGTPVRLYEENLSEDEFEISPLIDFTIWALENKSPDGKVNLELASNNEAENIRNLYYIYRASHLIIEFYFRLEKLCLDVPCSGNAKYAHIRVD